MALANRQKIRAGENIVIELNLVIRDKNMCVFKVER